MRKPRTRPRGQWCPDETNFFLWTGRRKVRCPTCGRRLLLAVVPEMAYRDENGLPWDPTPLRFKVPRHKTSKIK